MEDYRSEFQRVSRLLRDKGFGEIVEEVVSQLEIGCTYEQRDKPRSTSVLKHRRYSERESLILLLEAAERVTVEPRLMIETISSELLQLGIQRIVFEPSLELEEAAQVGVEPEQEGGALRRTEIDLSPTSTETPANPFRNILNQLRD